MVVLAEQHIFPFSTVQRDCPKQVGQVPLKYRRSEGLVNFDQFFFPNNLILKMADCCPRERISTQWAK